MGRLIDADKIIFCEIDEVGGDYEPYLGCSKSQINSLPTVEAIPKADYENRLKDDMVAMLVAIQLQFASHGCKDMHDCWWLIEEKINALKADRSETGKWANNDFGYTWSELE